MKFRAALFVIIISFSGILKLQAQDANSFYFMRGVPQTYQVNPAFQPDCNFFIGLPGLAPMKFRASHSSFDLGDLIQYSDRIDSLVTFLHPDGIGGEAFLERLDETNTLITEFSTSIASFGFRAGDTYFTFDIRERFSSRMDYSDDFLRFPIVGPDEGEVFDMNLGIDLSLMNEFSMGISQKFGDQLTVGLRGKLLFGQAGVFTENFDIGLATGEDVWSLSNNISINTSAPYLIDYINLAVSAPIETITGDIENFDPDISNLQEITHLALNPRNFGMALDIGADFRLNDQVQLSASLVDIGSVKWSENINFQHTASYEFEGVELYLSEDEDFAGDFLDSLETTFDNFTTTDTDLRKYLPGKLYLGGAFYVHPKISFGLLSRTDFYQKNIRQQYTASANFYPIRMISATFSYSVINNSYKNIGFGLALKAFPFNLYLLTDTGPSVYFFPTETKYYNFKIGMNLMFGCQKDEKKYDVPLIN